MNYRRVHKVVGLIMIVPLTAWLLTGLVFLTKPGYSAAYEQLAVKTYPIESRLKPALRSGWNEFRLLRTMLGHHFMARKEGQWFHFDPVTFSELGEPPVGQVRALLEEAISANVQRYGRITHEVDGVFYTSENIELRFNWPSLSISQNGADTRLIDALYKVHYLQWVGHKEGNLLLGVAGLCCLLVLIVYGVLLSLQASKKDSAVATGNPPHQEA